MKISCIKNEFKSAEMLKNKLNIKKYFWSWYFTRDWKKVEKKLLFSFLYEQKTLISTFLYTGIYMNLIFVYNENLKMLIFCKNNVKKDLSIDFLLTNWVMKCLLICLKYFLFIHYLNFKCCLNYKRKTRVEIIIENWN